MAELRRTLSLPLVVLYGLGVTIGAGIYVLLGATTARAGIHAPVSFVVAAIVMTFSAASYAELSSRFPVSAGEAAYVKAGFKSAWLSTVVGFLVIASGVVSSSAISLGSTGYIREFIDLPVTWLVVFIVLTLGVVAAWGIMESVLFASLFTVFEAGALLWIVAIGVSDRPSIIAEIPQILPSLGDQAGWAAVLSAGLLAFFAFIGFEDIVNVAEEMEHPEKTLPWAIFLTLGLGTIIYFMVTTVTVLSVPLDELAVSEAPLSFVFEHISGMSPLVITVIAITATLNGVIIQIIMASRVLYGLARQGSVPAIFGIVNPTTRTPLWSTSAICLLVLVLAILAPVDDLAEWTARIVLFVFAMVNGALFLLKLKGDRAQPQHFSVWIGIPVLGFLTSMALLAGQLISLAVFTA
jgi:APA family basic amino acid/polyamine antiporter